MAQGKHEHFDIIEGSCLAYHIPIIWAKPRKVEQHSQSNLVIWQTCFGGKKERVIAQLQDLARQGFTAISFDLIEHGERTLCNETHEQMVERVTSNRRLYFWPIIARTAEEFPRIIDWAIHHFNINGDVLAGGISMGGDISLVAASIDTRIKGVCATIATPDWLRPGSIDPQGEADTYSNLLYNRYNPITNLQLFSHVPYIHFENAADDLYVPAEAARRFQLQLKEDRYSQCPEKITINEHPNKNHGFHPEMWPNCLSWFCEKIK